MNHSPITKLLRAQTLGILIRYGQVLGLYNERCRGGEMAPHYWYESFIHCELQDKVKQTMHWEVKCDVLPTKYLVNEQYRAAVVWYIYQTRTQACCYRYYLPLLILCCNIFWPIPLFNTLVFYRTRSERPPHHPLCTMQGIFRHA